MPSNASDARFMSVAIYSLLHQILLILASSYTIDNNYIRELILLYIAIPLALRASRSRFMVAKLLERISSTAEM